MEEIRDLKLLEADLLWEVEVNASTAELIKDLMLPKDNIGNISTFIAKQLSTVTKSKYLNEDSRDPS